MIALSIAINLTRGSKLKPDLPFRTNRTKVTEFFTVAEEIGLESGDTILKINNTEIKDVLDYRYLINDEFITLVSSKIKTTEDK